MSADLRTTKEGGQVERPKTPGAFDFEIPPRVIDVLAGRDKTKLRRMTPIRKLPPAELDPAVQRALEKLQEKYRETGNKARDRLSELYLDDVEAVTARLNKQALPRITRFLLSVDGVYETMLLEAIESGVGREPGGRGNPASHAGYGPGSTAQVVSPRSGK